MWYVRQLKCKRLEKERWSKIRRNVCLYVFVVDRVSGKLSSKLYGVVTLKEFSTGRLSLSFWLKSTCQVHVEKKKRGTWLKCPHLLLNEQLFKKSYGWYQRSKGFFLQTDLNEKLSSNLLFVSKQSGTLFKDRLCWQLDNFMRTAYKSIFYLLLETSPLYLASPFVLLTSRFMWCFII